MNTMRDAIVRLQNAVICDQLPAPRPPRRLIVRLTAIAALCILWAGLASLWQAYAPGDGVGGAPLRAACYAVTAVLGLVTLAHPLSGLALTALVAPVLSAVPLLILDGNTYPLVLFGTMGFISGWLLREIIQPRLGGLFPGQGWLLVLLGMIVFSGASTILRYNPRWVWSHPEFLNQIINTKGMTRVDAVRYISFVLANGVAFALTVTSAYAIVHHRARTPVRAGRIVVWSLLIGAAVAAGVAWYQSQSPQHIFFCANKSYYWTRLRRTNGTCSDPNALGTMLALCMSLACMRVLFNGGMSSWKAWLERSAALGLVALYFWAICCSGSRSGLLAALLVCSGAAVLALVRYGNIALRRWHTPFAVRLSLLLVLGASGVVVWCLLPRVVETIDRKLTMSRSSQPLVRRLKRDLRQFQQRHRPLDMMNDQMRLIYWRYAKRFLRDEPISGIGLGAYVIELPNEISLIGERIYRTDNACNYYLHNGAELGVPGLAVLALFYGTLLTWFLMGLLQRRTLGGARKNYRLMLAVCLAIFMVVLVFGVHTLADEVNLAFAIVLGLIGAEHASVPMRLRIPDVARWSMRAAVCGMVALFVWQTIVLNRTTFNTERRLASCGLVSEQGWFGWESVSGQPFRARWIGSDALSVVARENLLLGIPVLSPPVVSASQPMVVRFYINGVLRHTHSFVTPGEWALITVPVPYADAFSPNSQAYATLRIVCSRTWVPKESNADADPRQLGVMIGELRWLEPAETSGGWYAPERWGDAKPFRWSGAYAWSKIAVGTNTHLQIPMYASHVLLRYRPLDVAIYLNRQRLGLVTFRDKRWKTYTYDLSGVQPGSTALVEFVSSRTWVPKHYGFDDGRALGVGVGTISVE